MPLSRDRLRELARVHIRAEADGDIDTILATLEADPFYELHPLGVRFSGRDAVRRYYEWLCTGFRARQRHTALIGEYVGDAGVIFEYRMWIARDDGTVVAHNLVGVDVAGDELLAGERVYAHPELIELMVGPVLAEAVPIPDQPGGGAAHS
jgi:hypothetical protein